MSKHVLVSGSAGFFGCHFVEHLVKNTDYRITGLDSFAHRGDSERTRGISKERYQIICHDLNSPISKRTQDIIGPVDYIVNIASDSHVTRSIQNPVPFIQNNVNLALHMFEYARKVKPEKFLHTATDEIFGPACEGMAHKEEDRWIPSSPYSSSKACQVAIGISYWRTYSLPLIVAMPANLFAEKQDAEKYIPLCIKKILKGETIEIHGSPENIGRRTYMHARNVADAFLFLLKTVDPVKYDPNSQKIQCCDMFNIFGEEEFSNLEVAQKIANILDKPLHYKFKSFEEARAGHDFLYRLNTDKMTKLGWKPPIDFEPSLRKMVEWTMREENKHWLL